MADLLWIVDVRFLKVDGGLAIDDDDNESE
jgi:hypothetical protein